MAVDFSANIIHWQRVHGRHDLPWQNTRDPYAIWVSEIMLQQTQVTAVIPFYQRFMARFPDLASLAAAEQDSVLQHWSGLGYYARARHLHIAAQTVMAQHGGAFPSEFDAICALPGIGRSTAAAIAAFAFGQRQAILDGNVKRVLARCFGVEGWPGSPAVEKRLWALAESLLPSSGIESYTQGLMDLGATLCRRSNPCCDPCPLRRNCIAQRQGRSGELPAGKPRQSHPQRQIIMLLLQDEQRILLEKRPPSGIWGSLWSLPEIAPDADPQQVARLQYGLETEWLPPLPAFRHSFSHFHLQVTPQPLRLLQHLPAAREGGGILWLERKEALAAALPAPVRKLLQRLSPPVPQAIPDSFKKMILRPH